MGLRRPFQRRETSPKGHHQSLSPEGDPRRRGSVVSRDCRQAAPVCRHRLGGKECGRHFNLPKR
eukprot:1556769-Pyramimonas_sp.AAC.1